VHVFVGKRGRLESQGVPRALERRADEAKVTGMDLHRHTRGHRLLKAGVHEGEVMRLMGWKSRSMLDRYAASAADDRAFASYDRLAAEGKL
jgi:integrase